MCPRSAGGPANGGGTVMSVDAVYAAAFARGENPDQLTAADVVRQRENRETGDTDMAIHYHVNVQTEGGYLPFNDEPGFYATFAEADAAALAEAEFDADSDMDGALSVLKAGPGCYILCDGTRDNDPYHLRTYVTVDSCDDAECQEAD